MEARRGLAREAERTASPSDSLATVPHAFSRHVSRVRNRRMQRQRAVERRGRQLLTDRARCLQRGIMVAIVTALIRVFKL